MIVGARLKKERIDRGLSQEELGNLIGVSKVSISGYEKGTRIPSLKTFIDIIDELNMTPSFLLGRDIKVISDINEPYTSLMAIDDIEIIKLFKSKPTVYNKILENPSRVIERISRVLK